MSENSNTSEKNYRGFDLITESYYIEDDTWKVDDDCKLGKKFTELETLYDTLETTTRDLKTGELDRKTGVSTIRATTKSILEKTLIGFNYETALKNNGYLTLDAVAMELVHLFLRVGGIKEMKHALKRLKDLQSGSSGSQD